LPWSRLVGPAIHFARDGFPVDAALAERIAAHRARFDPAAAAVFLPEGVPPEIGSRLRQTELARTLERLAALGAADFATGETAEALVRAVAQAGGILAPADLAGYRPVWREPVRGSYRGREVVSMPPPSSGGVHLIQMLQILEHWDLAAAPPDAPETVHLLAEAMKFAYADRSRWLGDPDFVDVPVAWLLSPAHLDSQRLRIVPEGVVDWRTVGGIAVAEQGEHTTHLSVVDAEGSAVAATLTINLGFGSGLMAAGTGVILNDEMDDFAAAPGVLNAFGLVGSEANAVAPGKRPLSSMTPTILLHDGAVVLVTGSPGGSRIITTTLQALLNVIDHGMDAEAALAFPRIHYQWVPNVLYHEESALDPVTRERLTACGHVLEVREPMGNAQLIRIDPVDGRIDAASDPRGAGAAGKTGRKP
jgi:gamma-glutamyltranspeptidase/glutathione hydrolase